MGGGDLNLKKSWHPSTLRNIERVWKAEQKHEVEKQKIEQLQKELAEERAREEIQTYAEDKGVVKKKDERLDWMYQGPAAMVNREEYLLGRKVDKTLETLKQMEEGVEPRKDDDDDIGSRMFSSQNLSGTATVDLATKIREDPLFSIMKKEKEERKNLLTNPVKMKQLQQMLEQSLASKKKKSKKSKKKHDSDSEEEIQEKRRKKHKKSESSESEKEQKPSKEYSRYLKGDDKLEKKKKKHRKQNSSDSEEEHRFLKESGKNHSKHKGYETERFPSEKRSFKHQNDKYSSYDKRIRSDEKERNHRSYEDSHSSNHHRQSSHESSHQRDCHSYRDHQSKPYDRDSRNPGEKKKKIDSAERERLLREMQENAKWREDQRKRNTQRYREEDEREEKAKKIPTSDFSKPMLSQAFGSGSLEDRVKQKIFYIQREKGDMNKHFARRE